MPVHDLVIAHSDGHRTAVTHQYHKLLGAGHGGVEQVALEHHKVLGQCRHDHGPELATLRLVHAHGVGVEELVELGELVDHDPVVDANSHLVVHRVQRSDASHVAVEHVLIIVVANLHHPVALAEHLRATAEFRPALSGWVQSQL